MAPISHSRPDGSAAASLQLWLDSPIVALRRYGPALAGWVLPFALVLYLALRGGGYDPVVRGEVGVAVWWIVLLGALVGVLPARRIGTAGWVGLGLLGVFALWTALGTTWSESAERSVAELGRIATYLGVLALALAAQGPDGLRRTVSALAAAVTVVATVALASRLQPEWFDGAREHAKFLPDVGNRLAHPVNYWNGLAALMAMGIPLLLGTSLRANYAVTRCLAAAAVPLLALTAFFTLSRGGAIEIAVAVAAFMALTPRRLAAFPTLLLTAVGSAILIGAALQRDALEDGLVSSAAHSQGDEMLAMTLIVCGGVALGQAALVLAHRYELGPGPITPRVARYGGIGLAVAALLAVLALGQSGFVSDRWAEFKSGAVEDQGTGRFASASGNGRYQYWQSAADANATETLTGTGAGTFEFWWAREGDLDGFVRDAHSLYFETLGELGIVGLLLIGSLVVWVLLRGARRALHGGRRSWNAAAAASAAAFATAALVDWVWELAVIPVAFLLLAAAILSPRTRSEPNTGSPRERVISRGALTVIAVVGIVAVGLPLAATALVRDSRAEYRAGDIEAALDKARDAEGISGYAATPALQEAMLLEQLGELDPAADAAREAADAESTNWRTWLVLSRIEAERGRASASVEAYRRARELNPRSPLFQ